MKGQCWQLLLWVWMEELQPALLLLKYKFNVSFCSSSCRCSIVFKILLPPLSPAAVAHQPAADVPAQWDEKPKLNFFDGFKGSGDDKWRASVAVHRGSNGVGGALQRRLDSDSSTGPRQPMARWMAASGRVPSSWALVSDSSDFQTVRKTLPV